MNRFPAKKIPPDGNIRGDIKILLIIISSVCDDLLALFIEDVDL
jgi:hypothetical protein